MQRKFKEILKGQREATELDLQYPFYENDEADEPNEIEYSQDMRYDSETPSMEIIEVIKIMMNLQAHGADRVYMVPHSDHNGYYFYGVELKEIL